MTELILGLVFGLAALIIVYKMVSGERTVGFDLLFGPVSIGILTGLFIYYVLPGTYSSLVIVSRVTGFVLNLSNSYVENLPTLFNDFVAQADLLEVATLVGVAIILVLLIFGIVKRTFIFLKYRITHWLENRKRKKKLDLPAIDMDMRYGQEKKDEIIFGSGMDSIERD